MKQFLAILIAIVFLGANLQLTLGTHYCGGRAVGTELLLGLGSDGCGMETEENSCELKKIYHGEVLSSIPCCKDEIQIVQIQNLFKVSKEVKRLTTPFLLFLREFPETDTGILSQFDLLSWQNHTRPPPDIGVDLQILHQTFII